MDTGWIRTLLLTALAMVAFAGNTLLCRLAMGDGAIDPASFTALRLLSGALMLALLVLARSGGLRLRPNPRATLFLFGYAAAFSFAYLHLDTGTGALILFGVVQLTMVSSGLRAGEPFPPLARVGLGMSLAGLLYLVSPGLTAPPLISAALMAIAGLSWGLYSLSGRGAGDPLRATAANFIGTLPLALLLWLTFADDLHLTAQGVVLAFISGALTSGVGYAIWFAAVRGLTASAAASVQLSVPVLSAAGGILWLGEPATLRLSLASVLILGGIALVLRRRAPARSASRP